MAKAQMLTITWTINNSHKNRLSGHSSSHSKIVFPYKGLETLVHHEHLGEGTFWADTQPDSHKGAIIVKPTKCLTCDRFSLLKSYLTSGWTLDGTDILSPDGLVCGHMHEIEDIEALAEKVLGVWLKTKKITAAMKFLDENLEDIRFLACPVGPSVPEVVQWVFPAPEYLKMPSGLYYHRDGYVGDLRNNGSKDYIHPLPRQSAQSPEALEAKAKLLGMETAYNAAQEQIKAREAALCAWGEWFLSLSPENRIRLALECEDGHLATVSGYVAREAMTRPDGSFKFTTKHSKLLLRPNAEGKLSSSRLDPFDSISLISVLLAEEVGEIRQEYKY